MSCRECSLCGYLTSDLKGHISHLRLVHKEETSFDVICGIGRCCDRFSTFSAYNTHIYRKHRREIGLLGTTPPDPITTVPESLTEDPGTPDNGDVWTEADSGIFDTSGGFDENDFHRKAHSDHNCETSTESNAKLLLKLSEGRKLSEVAIQDVITGCTNVCTAMQSELKDTVLQKLTEHQVDAAVTADVIQAISDTCQNPFAGLSSSYLREKYYKEHFNYIVSAHIE